MSNILESGRNNLQTFIDRRNPLKVEKDTSRRNFLKAGAVLALGAVANLSNIKTVAANIEPALGREINTQVDPDIIYNTIPWSSEYWWPTFRTTAEANNLPRLVDDWMYTSSGWVRGPLALHDEIARRVFDYRTYALDFEVDYTNFVANNHPEMVSWAGKCAALALAGISTAGVPRGFYVETEAGPADRVTIEGMEVAFSQGLPTVPIYKDSSGRLNSSVMANLLDNGMLLIADVPLRAGQWYRAVYKYRNQYLMTAFGDNPQVFPFDRAVTAWQVLPIGAEVTPALKAEAQTRVNPAMNRQVIDHIRGLG